MSWSKGITTIKLFLVPFIIDVSEVYSFSDNDEPLVINEKTKSVLDIHH